MLETCEQGHTFYKSSDCPVCPICESERKPVSGFLAELGAPARRALENADITTIKDLAETSESEILELHGMGPSSLPVLREALRKNGLTFKE